MWQADVQTEPGGTHSGLHSEKGAESGEHPGRSRNPLIKVTGLAWLEFEKPDLQQAELFARDFGFVVHHRDERNLVLRGAQAGSACVVVRKARRSRFTGLALQTADLSDLDRVARTHDRSVEPAPDPVGGSMVTLEDPSGLTVRVAHGSHDLAELPRQALQTFNVGGRHPRVNATQRPAREPARVERLGHLAMSTRVFRQALDWYLDNFGMIVSDFQFLDGQRDRGPVFAFIRCDQGSQPSDHHTLAMLLAPEVGYVHSAFEVADLDTLAAGGEYLREQGWTRSWGVGRHIQGSQIFDYWRDPDKYLIEHYTDGDVFDNTLEPGWAPLRASGLSQWGPPPTKDFLGTTPSPALVKNVIQALREDNDIDPGRIQGLLKGLNR